MNIETIEIRYKQAICSQQGMMRYPSIAVQDMAWAIQEIKQQQEIINQLTELVAYLQKG